MSNFLNTVFIFSKGIFISLLSSVVDFFLVQKSNQFSEACSINHNETTQTTEPVSEQWSAIWSCASLLLTRKNKQRENQEASLSTQNASCLSMYIQQTLTTLSFIVTVCFITIMKICQYSVLEDAATSLNKIITPIKHSFLPVAVFFFTLNKIIKTQLLTRRCVFFYSKLN
ncbi:hypothetical protein [Psychromonas ossibalaenae]|uniref:hypothetical protein n=1 Tax=Psychromonas ossibalaenae TaxID=444922 RepID=UPI00036C3A4A|nr:hypothetical protein [Psychromonas ossibalaenae]